MVGSKRVAEAMHRAEAVIAPVQPGWLAELAGDADARDRLLALALMRREIVRGAPARDFLPLARRMVEDPDNACRWQALIVVGEAVVTCPEEVREVVRAHGGSADPDLRMGVATVLLEHLLEEHFDDYFPKVREEVL